MIITIAIITSLIPSSGHKGTGRIIFEAVLITSALSTKWISKYFISLLHSPFSYYESEEWATFSEEYTTVWHKIPILSRILTRTCPTSFKTKFLFIVYLRNGCGANHGVAWKARRRQRQLTYVITHCIR